MENGFDLREYLKNNNLNEREEKILYDFGGADYVVSFPQTPEITKIISVDIEGESNFEELDYEYEDKEDLKPHTDHIQADLFKGGLVLPIKGHEINVSKLFRYEVSNENKINILIDNINNNLVKGGIVRIFEDSNSEENFFDLMGFIKQRFITKGYSLILDDATDKWGTETLILKK